MSNHEIEDVLSSIRRLVSEDLRPAPRPPELQGMSTPADKLLLTPALRVVTQLDVPEPQDDAASAAAAGFGDDAAFDADAAFADVPPLGIAGAGAAPGPFEDVVSRLGAAVAEEEWESPFGDPEVWPGSHADAEFAAVPEFVARPRVILEPLDAALDMPADFVDAAMDGFAASDEALPEPSPEAAALRREPLRHVTPPGDDAGWADAAEAAVHADLAQETEEEVISGLYGTQPGGMVFDEEVLRDLVRDLIREELSGTLGERITRNVRKLVRAEIARAMTLRDFE